LSQSITSLTFVRFLSPLDGLAGHICRQDISGQQDIGLLERAPRELARLTIPTTRH
jgi:hypothetical protein